MSQLHTSDLETQLVEAWEMLAVERYLGEMKPQQAPRAIIVTGQPAAGKSVMIESLRVGPLSDQQFVLVNPSELADLHPARPVLLKNGEFEAVDNLRSDAAELASTLLDRVVEAQSHLVLACTFDGEGSVEGLVEYLHENGYMVHILAVAVSPETTRQAYVKRRQELMPLSHDETSHALSYHDTMYHGFLDAISWLEVSSECELTLLDRTGNVLVHKLSDQVLAAGECSGILTTLSHDEDSLETISSKSTANKVSPHGEMSHPRFRTPRPTEKCDELKVVVGRANVADVPEKERQKIDQRLQFVQTLKRLAESERQGTY